jgi:hypothetical protein
LAALVEIYRGDQTEAARQLLLSEPMTMTTESPQWPALAAYAYARLNLDEDAARLLARFDELAAEQRVPAAADIMAHLARGEEEAALARLDEAAEERVPYEAFNLLMSIAANRFRDPVLDKPEFAAARGEIGFSDLFAISVPLSGAQARDRGGHPGPPPEAVEACANFRKAMSADFRTHGGMSKAAATFHLDLRSLWCAYLRAARPLSILADSLDLGSNVLWL